MNRLLNTRGALILEAPVGPEDRMWGSTVILPERLAERISQAAALAKRTRSNLPLAEQAAHFAVSETATAWRLYNFGLVDRPHERTMTFHRHWLSGCAGLREQAIG